MEAIGTIIVILILAIAIPVALARWVFRINDIVDRLDEIISRSHVPPAQLVYEPRKTPSDKDPKTRATEMAKSAINMAKHVIDKK